jgi:predicted nucleic acid-binding protein
MYLVDTNVISEVRKGRRADAGVQAFWSASIRDDSPIFLAAVTVGELRRGVELIRHRGDHPQALLLEQWLAEVLQQYGDRVPNPHNAIDKQIAAIALLHDLTVVTRNIDDFVGCGVRLNNPFAGR